MIPFSSWKMLPKIWVCPVFWFYKGKGTVVTCAAKVQMGNRGVASLIGTLALDGGEWSFSHCSQFTPGENSSTYWSGGWVGLRCGLDGPLWLECNLQSIQAIASHYTDTLPWPPLIVQRNLKVKIPRHSDDVMFWLWYTCDTSVGDGIHQASMVTIDI